MDTCYEEDKRPPSMDTATGTVPPASLLCREARRHLLGGSSLVLIRGIGGRRRAFDLQDIRAEG